MRVAAVNEFDEVVTDDGVPAEEIERLRALGLTLTIAPRGA